MENKFDKNYIIGLVLMFVIFGVYMTVFAPDPDTKTNTTQVSGENIKTTPVSNTIKSDSLVSGLTSQSDSTQQMNVPEKEFTVDNQDIRVTFSSKGGKIKQVALKNYKTYQDFEAKKDKEMVIFDGSNSSLDFEFLTNTGSLNISNLDFSTQAESATLKEGESKEIEFVAQVNGGRIIKKYEIDGSGYEIKHSIKAEGLNNLKKDPVIFSWKNEMQVLENDINENRKGSQINYYTNEKDQKTIGRFSTSDAKEDAKQPVKWFTFYQKYFTSGIIFENAYLEKAKFNLTVPTQDESVVKIGEAKAEIPYNQIVDNAANFKYYFGPNELKSLKLMGDDFQKNLYLGYDLVKPINRYIFVPLFDWVESFIHNYGLLIVIVVLIIKLALTPLIYKSYMSSAKMRVLAPEINAIKERVGDDAMKVQQETMKLYQQVGVNPLSGCIPMLLQMPILMSVFFLFPNLIMFRQKGFLWANDLSTYDSIINFGFNIPLLGNHISLFVVLMTISTLAYTYYNNQITPDQPGPVDMKKISYIFPLVFLFVLNSYPAALAFYYLVSNLVTILQQRIVKVFVNEEKIQTILDNNRRNYHANPKKKNKFSDFLEKQMQASEEMKKKTEDMKKERKKK